MGNLGLRRQADPARRERLEATEDRKRRGSPALTERALSGRRTAFVADECPHGVVAVVSAASVRCRALIDEGEVCGGLVELGGVCGRPGVGSLAGR